MLGLVFRSGRWAILGLLLGIALSVAAVATERNLVNTDSSNVAIGGYDTVAYFTEGQPVKGTSDFEQVWEDAKWQFSTASNRDLFVSDPERYAPRYGGFCVGGLALGVLRKVDPEAWAIVDDKLYLNYEKTDVPGFVENAPEEVAKADANWKRLGTRKSRFGTIQ